MREKRSGNNLHRQLVEMFREARQKVPTDGGRSLTAFSEFLGENTVASALWAGLKGSDEVAKIIQETSLDSNGLLVEALRKTVEEDTRIYRGEMSASGQGWN